MSRNPGPWEKVKARVEGTMEPFTELLYFGGLLIGTMAGAGGGLLVAVLAAFAAAAGLFAGVWTLLAVRYGIPELVRAIKFRRPSATAIALLAALGSLFGMGWFQATYSPAAIVFVVACLVAIFSAGKLGRGEP